MQRNALANNACSTCSKAHSHTISSVAEIVFDQNIEASPVKTPKHAMGAVLIAGAAETHQVLQLIPQYGQRWLILLTAISFSAELVLMSATSPGEAPISPCVTAQSKSKLTPAV